MTPLGIPQCCEAVAVILDNASRQIRALGQAYVRPDLNEAEQIPVARNAIKLAGGSLTQLLAMLPTEPKKQRASKIVEPVAPSMQTGKSPWAITGAAVRKYCAIVGRDSNVNRGKDFEQAKRELAAMAIDATTSERAPKELDNGSIQYRGPSPLRLRLIVVPPAKHSTDLPTLVDVLADNEGRRRNA